MMTYTLLSRNQEKRRLKKKRSLKQMMNNPNLSKLNKRILACTVCDSECRKTTGWGNPESDILFLGLNPHVEHPIDSTAVFAFDTSTYANDKKSGYMISAALKHLGYSIKDFYWYNLVCCSYAAGKPTSEMHDNCKPMFIDLVSNLPNLKTIICLGVDSYARVSKYDLDYKLVRATHPASFLYKRLDYTHYSKELKEIISSFRYNNSCQQLKESEQ
jgi:uracil-DNA glycosylase